MGQRVGEDGVGGVSKSRAKDGQWHEICILIYKFLIENTVTVIKQASITVTYTYIWAST